MEFNPNDYVVKECKDKKGAVLDVLSPTACNPDNRADVGVRYGRWTIKKVSFRRHRPAAGSDVHISKKVLCECQCGARKWVLFSNLNYGLSLSCGCLRKEVVGDLSKTRVRKSKYPKREVGYRVGYMVIIDPEFSDVKPEVPSQYVVKCICGKEFLIPRHYLESGRYKSCGCVRYKYRGKDQTI